MTTEDHTSEALDALSERIDRAIDSLGVLRGMREPGSPHHARLSAKIEGLALAGAYLDEERRIVRGDS